MATAILLYNGLHFPVAMIDRAIAWAANSNGDIIALLVLADKDQEEGYPFPNDLDESEEVSTDNDAMGKDLAIIASNIRLMRHQATIANVRLKAHLLAGAHRAALQEWLEKADQVFISEEPLDPPVLSIDFSKVQTSLAGISAAIEWINA